MNNKIKVPKTKKQKLFRKHIKLIIILIMLLLVLISLFIFKKTIKKEDKKEEKVEEIKKEEKKLTVYNEDSKERPLAVMISNDYTAKSRQYGLQDAYLLYEITVEGGITRIVALFKDVNVEKIGPVRSSRHYFLDYAIESDAIYAHYGWSPQAEKDISNFKVNNLNGIVNPSNMYYRDSNYDSPNNVYTSIESIKKASENKGYSLTSENYEVLNYSTEEVDLSKDNTYKIANNVKINYSGAYVKYVYDETNKYYLRYNSEKEHIDLNTNKQVHVKNILVLKIDNTPIPGDDKGRQNLNNTGSGDGVYITNGGAIDITWKKNTRTSKTIYKDKSGNIIKINDGNTFVQIQPKSRDLIIE